MIILNVFAHTFEKTFKRKSDGQQFTMRFQEAEIQRGDLRPRVVEIGVRDGQEYREGLYTLSSDSIRAGAYDRIELGFVSLEPLEDAIEAAQTVLSARGTNKKK